jgi:hypothetical protein
MLAAMAWVSVHCGLHKTGSTAIQFACARHRAILLANGVFYPPSGPHAGHHNLAWELTGDKRFDPRAITWQSTIGQIAGFPGDVVLSSEDFESLLHRPEILLPMVEAIQATGKQVRFIIYVRPAARYAESLYLELLKHRYAAPFGEYALEINRTGALRYESWVYQFDIARVRAALDGIPGLQVDLRRYSESFAESVVADFLRAIGLPPNTFGTAALSRVNQRHPVAVSLYLFLSNRLGRALTKAECDIIQKLTPRKSVSWSIGNPCGGNAPVHYLGRVFSLRTVSTICSVANAGLAWHPGLDTLDAWWQGHAPADRVRQLDSPQLISAGR